MSRPESSTWRRRVAAALAVVAVVGAYGFTLERLIANVGGDIAFGSAERDGAAYLRPLVQLLAATADAQSAAVAGRAPEGTRLTETRAAVAAADAALGPELGTTTRWKDLESRLDRLADTAPTGADGYARWSEVVDLELALVAAVGDSSNLILDPQLDVYYVMDSVLLRLPAVVVSAGRVSDLNRLSTAAGGEATGAVVVERTNLGTLAAGVDTGLRKSFGTTRSRTLGPALLGRLDRLRDATSRLAPPVAALGAVTATPSPQDDETARRQVRDAALALEAAAIDELDALLATRVDGLRTQRLLVLGAGAGAAALLALAGWLVLPRRRAATGDEDDDEPVLPETLGDGDLVEARDLLEARQLVRSGRAIATARDTR